MINKIILIGIKTMIKEKIDYFNEELYPTKHRDCDYSVEANLIMEGKLKAYNDVLNLINETLKELENKNV